MNKQKVLTIRFKNTISQEEIPQFRGAIINTMENANFLFHNHENDRLRYAYPLIQYKRINKCAAIVCIGEGTDAIGEFFSNCNFDVSLGGRKMRLEIDSVKASQIIVQVWDDLFHYRINKWLPLNHYNYQQYQALEGVVDKCAMLEKILVGNMLSFAKGLGLHIDHQIICKITDQDDPYVIYYKGVNMTAFNVRFKSNMSVPDFIGLGKGVSLGFGTVTRKYRDEE